MRRLITILTVFMLILGVTALAQKPKAPEKATKQTISNGLGAGIYCVNYPIADVHNLGWLPANTHFRIDFESIGTSNPIAILSSNSFEGGIARGEMITSDDEGGDTNPLFDVTKAYSAGWVLSVSSAQNAPSCYTFRFTVVG